MPRPRPGIGSVPGRRWASKNGTPVCWNDASSALPEARVPVPLPRGGGP
jgi:hypothetical protein